MDKIEFSFVTADSSQHVVVSDMGLIHVRDIVLRDSHIKMKHNGGFPFIPFFNFISWKRFFCHNFFLSVFHYLNNF